LKYFYQILFISFVLFFTACSSKQSININQIESFSLSNQIRIANTTRTVKSPVSVGLGVGGIVSRHVGIGVSTSIRPNISNDENVQLERSLALNNISLGNIIEAEFKNQMTNDAFYKNKFVPFGADYTIYLYVPSYSLENAFFSSKAQVEIEINLRILNRNDEIVYEDNQKNIFYSKDYIYDENQILTNSNILQKVMTTAVRNSIAKLIIEMKKR
jgi:hypothetical protein